jgi:two-component system response regulator YesN
MAQNLVADEYKYVKKLDTKRLEELLRSGGIETCGRVLDEVLEEVRFGELRSLVLRLYVVTDIYIAARSFSREIGVTDEEFIRQFGGTDDIETRLGTAQSTAGFLKEMFSRCILWRIERSKENGNCVVRNARSYIDENYMKSELSLTTVASAVGISPTYLSALFKKETGGTLTDFILGEKTEEAKRLLRYSDRTLSAVSEYLGFSSPGHFSRVFRKYAGTTPNEYRERYR